MNYINRLKQPTELTPAHHQSFPWAKIDKVFLDLDGTLLDKYFDDYFWERFVPEIYSKKKLVSVKDAREHLLATYKSVENTLDWTDLDYWSKQLGLDIAQLKYEIRHLIQARPEVNKFLNYIHKLGKTVYLVTNAHPEALQIKLKQVDLSPWFQDQICSKDVGAAKEQLEFWYNFEKMIPFDKETTLFIDDTLKVLDTAREFGIKHLVHIAKPSSKETPRYSDTYRSICSFQELI